MTDTFDTHFEPATPKAAKKKEAKPKQEPPEVEQPLAAAPLRLEVNKVPRKKRAPNKRNDIEEFRQLMLLMKALPKARRKVALNMMSIMFD